LSDSDADVVGFVLAGGESSRMGTDKASVTLGGEPLIARAAATLRNAGLAVAIAGARSDLSAFAPVVEDAGQGPLGGICAALAWMQSSQAALPSQSRRAGSLSAVFLSIDTPFLPGSLVVVLLERLRLSDAAVVAASVNGFVETFPFAVDCALLPGLKAEQEAGNTGCRSALRAAAARLNRPFAILPVEELAQTGHVEHPGGWPPSFWFRNLNTREDLARAEAVLGEHRVI
jgi:molybdenum cofactor guanylyltransferase